MSQARAPGAAPARRLLHRPPTASSAANPDQELAEAALLAPDDLEGDFRARPRRADWPYSAEIAGQAPPCEPFAELVFGGGAQHAPSATVTLARQESYLFTNVVVFPTVEEAETLMNAVELLRVRRLLGAVHGRRCDRRGPLESARRTTHKANPPDLTLDADDSVTRKVERDDRDRRRRVRRQLRLRVLAGG